MSGHTPGRLTVHQNGYCIVSNDGKTAVAHAYLVNQIPQTDVANARRLVACWNMLTDFSTERIEADDVDWQKLTVERDNLLTAIGECRDAMPSTSARVNDAIADPLAVPDYVRASVAHLTAQRDELLAALKSLMEMLDDEIQASTDEQLAFGLSDPNCPEHVKSELKIVIACRAAIAKAGGDV